MKEYPIYVAGQFRRTDKPLEVCAPHDGQVFARTWLAGAAELEEAIGAAEVAREPLADLPGYERSRLLALVADGLEARRGELALDLAREAAKPLRYALGELDRAIQTFRVASEECRRLPDELLSLDWTPAGQGREGIVRHFPLGLVAGIAPFNFPLNLAVHKIAPALAAGCPIVLKPARKTPLSVLNLAQVLHAVGWPAGSVSILPMDRQAGDQLVTDPRFHLLSFTGSPQVGWDLKARAGKKKVALELGGNAGTIVAQSAELDWAVARCLVGAFAYSGQVCIHAQRIYVHESLFEEFARRFVEGAQRLRAGDPLDEQTEIAAMIDHENASRVQEWVDEAVGQGARLLCGGKAQGSYFPPTVLTDTLRGMKVCCMEVFGPVAVLERFSDFGQALDWVNDSDFGLQAGLFTDSQRELDLAFRRLRVGGLVHNDSPIFRVDHMPYGGLKDSGLGREGVRYAMREMMEPRLLVKSRF